MNTYNQLEQIRKKRGTCALALVDPDRKNDHHLDRIIKVISRSDFDGILIGGSLIMDSGFEDRLKKIKDLTDLPVIIFPGSSRQLSGVADAVLYLSLLSGRNPQYLIGEHVQSAPVIHSLGLEAIPTGYILLDGGSTSSVQVMSNTNPLPMSKKDIILAHALAGQYLGMKFIFLEAGSGAKVHVDADLVKFISESLEIPVIAGGGIRTTESARDIAQAGAGYVVFGTILEDNVSDDSSHRFASALAKAVHYLEY